MKNRKLIKITTAIVSTLLIAFLISPGYIKKTIIHLFPNIDDYKIFNNRIIQATNPKKWSTAYDYMHNSLNKYERDSLEKYNTVAFLVIQNDSIVYEEYWDEHKEYSISNSFSASKSVIGLLIGAAIQDGYIKNINQNVCEFLPEFNTKSKKNISIKHLLTMSSGLNWEESYANPFSMTTQAYYGDNINKLVLNLDSIEPPGKNFKYLSGNTQLLSIIIKNATNQNIAEYAQKKLWEPLGATHDALWSTDKKDGTEKAYCCLNSTARDFARIGKLILDTGIVNNHHIIPHDYIMESISPATFLRDPNSGEKVDFYGYQWWITTFKNQKIPYARGIYGQYIFVLPKQNAIIVRLGHKRSKAKIGQHPIDIYNYLSAGNRILIERNKKSHQ